MKVSELICILSACNKDFEVIHKNCNGISSISDVSIDTMRIPLFIDQKYHLPEFEGENADPRFAYKEVKVVALK